MQGALKLILEPVFEADFQSGSYGYRPKRAPHQAVERVMQGILLGTLDIIDLDLRVCIRFRMSFCYIRCESTPTVHGCCCTLTVSVRPTHLVPSL